MADRLRSAPRPATWSSCSPPIDLWIYPLLFAVIFCRDRLVVTPFLPGDSLLFAVGALAAVDSTGTLPAPRSRARSWRWRRCSATPCNYSIGRAIGPPAFSGRYRLLKVEYLHRTEEFFVQPRRARDLPVALHAHHPHLRAVRRRRRAHALRALPHLESLRRLLPGCLLFIWGGYLFGNIPLVKQHFGLVTLASSRSRWCRSRARWATARRPGLPPPGGASERAAQKACARCRGVRRASSVTFGSALSRINPRSRPPRPDTYPRK